MALRCHQLNVVAMAFTSSVPGTDGKNCWHFSGAAWRNLGQTRSWPCDDSGEWQGKEDISLPRALRSAQLGKRNLGEFTSSVSSEYVKTFSSHSSAQSAQFPVPVITGSIVFTSTNTDFKMYNCLYCSEVYYSWIVSPGHR